MAQWFESGRVIDCIVALMMLEAAGLIAYRALTGRGLALRSVVAALGAGLALLLAVRAALTGAGWPWVAMSLFAALIAHVSDLWLRLRIGPGVAPRSVDWRMR